MVQKLNNVGWLALTGGLSAWWANQELFWGHYWNWDPVEMTFLIHFLSLGWLGHKFMANTSRRGVYKGVMVGFLTPLILYLLNKSPAAQSIHSFSGSFFLTLGTLSGQILLLLLLVPMAVTVIVVAKSSKYFRLTLPTLKKLTWGFKPVNLVAGVLCAFLILYLVSTLPVALLNNDNFILSKKTISTVFLFTLTATVLYSPIRDYKIHITQNTTLPRSHITPILLILTLSLPWLKARPCTYLDTIWVDGGPRDQFSYLVSEIKIIEQGTLLQDSLYTQTPYNLSLTPRHTIQQTSSGSNNRYQPHIFYKFSTKTYNLVLSDRVLKPVL